MAKKKSESTQQVHLLTNIENLVNLLNGIETAKLEPGFASSVKVLREDLAFHINDYKEACKDRNAKLSGDALAEFARQCDISLNYYQKKLARSSFLPNEIAEKIDRFSEGHSNFKNLFKKMGYTEKTKFEVDHAGVINAFKEVKASIEQAKKTALKGEVDEAKEVNQGPSAPKV